MIAMPRRVLVAAFLAVLAAMPAVAQPKSAAPGGAEDPVVARVNGTVLHRSDIELALRGAPPQVQKQPLDKIYPQVLNSLVNAQLLSQAGRKAKIDQTPEVKEQIMAAENEIIADAYVASLARTQITEAKLRAAYDQYAKAAPQTEEVHARHILVASEQEAKDIIDQLNKGADFATLAKEKTIDPPGKTDGGDLGYFTKGDMLPEISAAAFALKPGEYTKTPIHTQYGWHVVKVEDRRPGKAAAYEQVAPEIAQQMTQQIVAAKLQELRGQGKIELFGPDGKALAAAAPAQAAPALKAAPAAKPVAPTLSLPGGGSAGAAPGAPTLSPATAPDQLGH
jgi:peptidyl-prolyl cis-trans isomerase C